MASFYHAGDIGDLVYGLAVVKALGGGELFLGERTDLGDLQPRVGIRKEDMLNLVTLLKLQPYVKKVQWMAMPPFVTYDLNEFRKHWLGLLPGTGEFTHLLVMHCVAFGVTLDHEVPWLESPANWVAGTVFARSFRQRNHKFPWAEVVKKYEDAVFVGTEAEYKDFVERFGTVRYCPTPTLAQMAEVIQGCDLFVGNSSAPLAVAEGLKKRVLQETSATTLEKAHTRSLRSGAVDWYEGVRI